MFGGNKRGEQNKEFYIYNLQFLLTLSKTCSPRLISLCHELHTHVLCASEKLTLIAVQNYNKILT